MKYLNDSKRLAGRVLSTVSPYATVAMVSGGDDSLTALHVALECGVKIDYIGHGITGTGTKKTTQFVEDVANNLGIPIIYADAGDAYEKYVMRKGFFGRGRKAHTYAYHILKAQPFRKMISREIRHGKRNRPVLLISGARLDESENRSKNLTRYTNRDPASKNNIWFNIIHRWTKGQCLVYLSSRGIKRNPVSAALGRSGECMCGTMQCKESYAEMAAFDPEWGDRMAGVREQVVSKHGYDWGDPIPQWKTQVKNGQIFLPGLTPMCTSCMVGAE